MKNNSAPQFYIQLLCNLYYYKKLLLLLINSYSQKNKLNLQKIKTHNEIVAHTMITFLLLAKIPLKNANPATSHPCSTFFNKINFMRDSGNSEVAQTFALTL